MTQTTGDPPYNLPQLQWPYYPVIPQAGWLCTRCQAMVSPTVQMCPNCTPPKGCEVTASTDLP